MAEYKPPFIDDGASLVEPEIIDPKVLSDTSKLHYIGLTQPPRPGVNLFATILEHTFFKPQTEKNKLFEFRMMRWSGLVNYLMVWIIVSIPKEFKEHANVCIDKAALRAVRAVPTIFEVPTGIPARPWAPSVVAVSDLNKLKQHPVTAQARNIQQFPMNGDTVFTLENENNHPIYKDLRAYNTFVDIERQLCEKICTPETKEQERILKEAYAKLKKIFKEP